VRIDKNVSDFVVVLGTFARGDVVKTDCGCGGACMSDELLIDVIRRGPLLEGGATVQERSKHDSQASLRLLWLSTEEGNDQEGPSVVLNPFFCAPLLVTPTT
jgi:hypothetical protein